MLKSRKPFGFAGLWETWKPPEGDEIKSCAIITTNANEFLKDVHDRMPVILPREKENVWLDPDAEITRLLALLKPYDSAAMEYYPVMRAVNSPAASSASSAAPLGATRPDAESHPDCTPAQIAARNQMGNVN